MASESGSIRKAMGPCRRFLVEALDKKPDLARQLQSKEERDLHLAALKAYKESLTLKAHRFEQYHKQLITLEHTDPDEASRVEQVIEQDSEILGRFDDVMASVNTAILAIVDQQKDEVEEARVRTQNVGNVAARDHSQTAEDSSARASVSPFRSFGVRLPKLELAKFSGNVFAWREFWDSFESAVDLNTSISAVEKMNYLKANLMGEAKRAVMGLAATNENYDVAIHILKERFGNKQTVIDAHYSALSDLAPSSNQLGKLRFTVDFLEQHLNALEALGEDVEHRHFVSLIRKKLPSEVIFHLEELRENDAWDVQTLRDRLRRYLAARELAESQKGSNDRQKSDYGKHSGHSPGMPTTGALLSSSGKTRQQGKWNRARPHCAYCGKEHWSDQCQEFSTVDARKAKIKSHCFGCLGKGHMIGECEKVKRCYFCKEERSHHSSLCPTKFSTAPSSISAVAAADEGHSVTASVTPAATAEASLLATGETVLLQTATTAVSSTRGQNWVNTRLLFDSASHRSYISAKLAKALGLRPHMKEKLPVFTFGSADTKYIETTVVTVRIRLLDQTFCEITANVVPTITGSIRREPVDLKKFGMLYASLPLADSIADRPENVPVDFLIGMDFYGELVTTERIELSRGLYMMGSKLGWIVCGRQDATSPKKSPLCTMFIGSALGVENSSVSLISADESALEKLSLKFMWDLETMGIKEKSSDPGDEEALQRFDATVRYSDGRYHVCWPWKEEDPVLPENFQLSMGRLNSLLRKFGDQPEIFQQYQAVLDSQIAQGIIEKVDPADGKATRKHYLPHHAVVTPSKSTTKVRIVYDGSAKAGKGRKSLNECLHRGPVFLEDLCSLLIRFRLHKLGIVADIEKAFLQIGLQAEERDVTRFIWLKDPSKLSTENNLQIMRFTRVPFGIISSPFLLAATMAYHLKQDGSAVATKILGNVYVDNIITGVASDEEAVEFYMESKKIFQKASMNLREWASNSDCFLNQISDVDRATGKVTKVLGYPWHFDEDVLKVSVLEDRSLHEDVTKRSVLKFIASIFDPLGLFSPVVLPGKIFLQGLWLEQMDWDEILSEEKRAEWCAIVGRLLPLTQLKVPRFIGVSASEEFELHCFCDASQKAYGTCIYLRSGFSGSFFSHLVFAKCRVAPVTEVSLPRLELLAVYMGSKCLRFVLRSLLALPSRQFIWTDSKCVLSWLDSNKPLPVFVRNRVSTIRNYTGVDFRYVPTAENPADLASRGMAAIEMAQCTKWWQGPVWLGEDNNKWPADEINISLQSSVEEQNFDEDSTLVAPEGAIANSEITPLLAIDFKKFSSLPKLLRITALVIRYLDRLRKRPAETSNVTAREISEAKWRWVKHIQEKCYIDGLMALRKGKHHPLINQLGLWMDENGIVRCGGGRLENSGLGDLTVFPALLPRRDYFTELVIMDFHRKLFHSGVSHTLAQVRTEFWIPGGRSEVFRILRVCNPCRKFDGGPYKLPNMPALPRSRVTVSVPFSTTGLDYLGPLYVKEDRISKKIWVCLFTCLATRAVHLEIVADMTAEQFLMCLRRFMARRGSPSTIICDNAPQFKLVRSAMDIAWKKVIMDKTVSTYISQKGISWKFIVECAPWRGGFYERLVRLVKQCLRKSIGKICLTFVQLQTVLTEIEAVINSRPLAYVGADFDSGQLITPAHFLTLNAKTGIPVFDRGSEKDEDYQCRMSSQDKLIESWKTGQRHLEHFWSLWQQDYLLSLRERTQQKVKQPYCRSGFPPSVGDVVLVRHEGPRGSWRIARIEELLSDSDGEVRSAQILLPSGTRLKRSVAHLYPLESTEQEAHNKETDTQCKGTIQLPNKDILHGNNEERKQTRLAAKRASDKIRQIYQGEDDLSE